MDTERFDGLFATIAEGVHGIENLMDAFFGFLGRKTDFYQLVTGTERDAAKEVVLRYYEKHRAPALERLDAERRKLREADARRQSKEKAALKKFRQEQEQLQRGPRVEEVFDDDSKNGIAEMAKTKTTAAVSSAKADADDNDDGPAPIGNGGTTDRYTWTQTLSTVDVLIPLDPPLASSRQCKVNITASKLEVIIHGTTFLEGKFHSKVKAHECLWTLEDLRVLHLTLEKQEGMKWWSCVLEGDPTIDTKKIQPENSKLSDLDPELRQTVEKMMFDQDQKARGLPTSDQRKQAEILEAFKKQHPEMDFSQAKINWGSGGGTGMSQFGGFS